MRVSVATVLASVALLAACSSGTGGATGSTDQPACESEAVMPAVTTAIGTDESVRQINGLDCKDGWAVVFPTIGPADGSTEGEIDITVVLKAESGGWVNQDRSAVCGTSPVGDGSPAYPSDAQVPASLWRGGCQTN